MRKILLASLLFLFLLPLFNGCSSLQYEYTTRTPNHKPIKVIHVYIDKEFGNEDRLSIDDALLAWNYALNNFIVLLDDYNQNNYAEDTIYFFNMPGNDPRARPEFLAFTNAVGGNTIYLIRERIDAKDIKTVSMHELGHALGSKHTNEESLMGPNLSEKWRCIDKLTIENVAKYQHLNPEKLNCCIYLAGS